MSASPTKAKTGFGSILSVGNDATPTVYTDCLELTSITPPNAKRDTVDASNLTSPGNRKEFLNGQMDPGEVSFEGNYIGKTNDAGYSALSDLFDSGDRAPFKITGPDNLVTLTFEAIITELSISKLENNKPVTYSGKLKVSGVVTEA